MYCSTSSVVREALLTTLLVLAIDESLCREEDARRDHVSLTVTSPRARVTDIRPPPPPSILPCLPHTTRVYHPRLEFDSDNLPQDYINSRLQMGRGLAFGCSRAHQVIIT